MGQVASGLNLALGHSRIADVADHAIQPDPFLAIIIDRRLIRQLGKLQAIHPGRHLVKNFPKAINIRLLRARSLGRHKTLRPNKSPLVLGRHQSDVCQLRLAIDKDDVRRFDIAVGQTAFM